MFHEQFSNSNYYTTYLHEEPPKPHAAGRHTQCKLEFTIDGGHRLQYYDCNNMATNLNLTSITFRSWHRGSERFRIFCVAQCVTGESKDVGGASLRMRGDRSAMEWGCCSGSYGKCEFLKSEGRDRARGRPGAGGRVGSACGERVPGGSCPPVPRSSPQAKFWDHTPERRYSPGAGRASLAARAPPVPARAPGAHAPVRTPPPGPLVLQLLQLLLAFLSRACGMMLLANLVSKCFGYPFSTRTHPIKSQTSPLDRNRSPPMRFNGGRSSSYYPAPLRKLKNKIKCGIYGS